MSDSVNLVTTGGAWRKLFTTNKTTSFTALGLPGQNTKPGITFAPLQAELANSGVVDMATQSVPGAAVPNSVQFKFFGAGAATNAIKVRIWGWEEGPGIQNPGKGVWWEPVMLAEFLATLGNGVVGVASGLILDTDLEASTVAKTYGADSDIAIMSNGADFRGCWARLDLQGFRLWQAEIDKNSAASGNLLYRPVS